MSVSVEAAVDGNQRRFEGGERSRHFIDCDLFSHASPECLREQPSISGIGGQHLLHVLRRTCHLVRREQRFRSLLLQRRSPSVPEKSAEKPDVPKRWRVATQLRAGAACRTDARGPCSHARPASIAISEVWMVAMCAGNATICGKSGIEKQQPTKVDLLRSKAVLHHRKRYAQSTLPGSCRVHLIQAHQMTAAVPAFKFEAGWRDERHVRRREQSE